MSSPGDPLRVLGGGDLPVHPDPAFAQRLRTRLESALSLPANTEGVDMSGTDTAVARLNTAPNTDVPEPAPLPRPAALPYLQVRNARRALRWYTEALGAVVIGEPIIMADNRVGHAELAIGGGVLYLADEFPELGLRAPAAGAVSVSLMLPVGDTDAALARAAEHGATVVREVDEAHGSRNAAFLDPFGHRWMLSGPMRTAPAPIRHGDVGYVSVWTPDPRRAAAFYGHVLGWTYDEDTHRVTNTAEPVGIVAAPGQHMLFCCYAVADLDAARRAILGAGGRTGESSESGFGTVLDATDPAGARFAVFEPTGGVRRPALNGAGPGELAYITHQVPDSAAFRRFYGAVLHWDFEPGRVEDGWQVSGSHPMAGVAGGGRAPATVPMWTVAEMDSAVARVREAGGTVVQEPSRQAYGLMAECTDDQGGRFYLGEF
ncbi:VOC family protein [Mycolicibacterium palauense]|uniref:VOC family protein n=1 Tax=Mycolicibacterium palauense TaxID=2034511 RepID=UPI000BFECD90|nr:VOC family protein [Mycolicibacterium palauense]